jgi:hypothetical protein
MSSSKQTNAGDKFILKIPMSVMSQNYFNFIIFGNKFSNFSFGTSLITLLLCLVLTAGAVPRHVVVRVRKVAGPQPEQLVEQQPIAAVRVIASLKHQLQRRSRLHSK